MKRIVRRVQSLNERAAELTAAAGQLPNRVAELRQAVTATSGELQNLKNGIQVNVADLQVDREDDLSEALAEVAGHAPVLAEAGFILDAMDVEISPVQRLIVQLVRYRDVDTLAIQAMIQKHQQQKSVRAILSAILKARAVVETIEIDGLDYHKLTIGIGPVPTIRLCWRDTATDADDVRPLEKKRKSSDESPGLQTSFFGPAPVFSPMPGSVPATRAEEEIQEVEEVVDVVEEAPELPVAATVPPPAPPPMPSARPPAPPPLPDPADPLARFKVMPRLDRQ